MSLLNNGGSGQADPNAGVGGSGAGNGGSAANSGANSGAGGGDPQSWHASLPEDLRDNATLKNFKDIPSLAKSYLHAQQAISKKGVIPPGEKATDEEWTNFYKAIGQPELDKFELTIPKDKPMNQESLAKYKEVSHKLGLLPKQAQGIFDWLNSTQEEAVKAHQDAVTTKKKEEHDGLRKEWGQGFDKQIQLAKLAVKEVGGDELQKYLEDSGLGDDVRLVKMLAKMGSIIGEDKIRGDGGGAFGQTPAEIKAEIDRVMGDPKNPYFDKQHPGHKGAVAKMEELYKKLHGT